MDKVRFREKKKKNKKGDGITLLLEKKKSLLWKEFTYMFEYLMDIEEKK